MTVLGEDKLTGRDEVKDSRPVLGEDMEDRTSFPASVKVRDWERFISSSGNIVIPWASNSLNTINYGQKGQFGY